MICQRLSAVFSANKLAPSIFEWSVGSWYLFFDMRMFDRSASEKHNRNVNKI
ncbi:MAG: hypothetical protein WBN39_06205 [Flavobacteriaceae bacterium]